MKYRYQRRVSFSDTDAAGVVHFSRILCYVEEAEHELLDSLDIPLQGNGGWPRVSVECDYNAPILPEDTIEVTISPDRIGKSSIHWGFEVSNSNGICARGMIKTVRVDPDGKPAPIDACWRERLKT